MLLWFFALVRCWSQAKVLSLLMERFIAAFILFKIVWSWMLVKHSFLMLFLIAIFVTLITNKFFVELFHPQQEFDDQGAFDSTFINIAENTRIFRNVFLCKVSSILCTLNYWALSEIILFDLPLPAKNLLRHPKNWAVVISSTSSSCIAFNPMQVEIHSHALLRTIPYFAYNAPK